MLMTASRKSRSRYLDNVIEAVIALADPRPGAAVAPSRQDGAP
jgi:hypothetical protein